MPASIFIGIDPGASGGLVCIDPNPPGRTIMSTPMPRTERDIWDWLSSLSDVFPEEERFAVIEKVGGYVGQGQPGSAMFKFGRNVGVLIGCLTAAGIPFEEITPQRWQKALGIPPRKKTESKTQWKNRLKSFAQKLYPSVTATLSTCDALLIAEFCRRYKS